MPPLPAACGRPSARPRRVQAFTLLPGALQTGYLNSYLNNPQAVMNNEGGFLRWVMCGR